MCTIRLHIHILALVVWTRLTCSQHSEKTFTSTATIFNESIELQYVPSEGRATKATTHNYMKPSMLTRNRRTIAMGQSWPTLVAITLFLLIATADAVNSGHMIEAAPLFTTARLPKKECTPTYIGNGAACICYLFSRDGQYPDDTRPFCQAAYARPSSQRPKCDGYMLAGTISQPDVEETLMWSVENCLTTPALPAPAGRLQLRQRPTSSTDALPALPHSDRLFFFALAPLVSKVVLKAAVFAGRQLARRAATRLTARRGAVRAAQRARDKFRGALCGLRNRRKRRQRDAAQRKLDAEKRREQAAKSRSDVAEKRSSGITDKVGRAEKAARELARKIVSRARKKARELVKEAKKFAREEATAVAECIEERAQQLNADGEQLVDVDAGSVVEEVRKCLAASKVVCSGVLTAEAVREQKDPESLSFFADITTCLSDSDAVCAAVATVKFRDGQLNQQQYAAQVGVCFEDVRQCARLLIRLVTKGKDVDIEDALAQATACINEAEELDNDKPKARSR